MCCPIGDDIHNLATLQLIVEGYQARDQTACLSHISDDACAVTVITDIGMNAVGHIQRRRATWQILYLTFGGKDKDLLLEDIAFDGFHKLVRALGQLSLP